MAKLTVAILLSICLLRASAIRTNKEERKQKVVGTRLCQEQYGSYYYDEVLSYCCPCSVCESAYGISPESVISCVMMGADHCKAPYSTLCRDIGHPPTLTEIPPVAPIMNTTVVAPPTDGHLTLPKSDPITRPDKQNSTFSIVLIAVGVMIFMCVTVAFTCLCCFIRCHGNRASKLIEKFPKWPGCSNDTTPVSSEQTSESSQDCRLLTVTGDPAAPNGIHPSQRPSMMSQHGPPEMAIPIMVRPDSRMSSCGLSEQTSSLRPSHHSFTESAESGSRHIVASRLHPQNVNTYPEGQGITTTISGCSNLGVIAAPTSHVVIHHLNVNCRASDPSHMNIMNQQIRVEGPENHRTFHEPIEGSGNWSRGHELALHRQSSEISSNSSGPVENDSHAARWDHSLAREDQSCALSKNCLPSQREEHSFNNNSSASGSSWHRGTMSYPTMSSDVSSYPSQRNSSGLPPQGDMVGDQ